MPDTTTTDTTAVADTSAADAAVAASVAASAAAQAAATATTTDATATTDTAVAAVVVPETYDLKLPDGSTADPSIVERTTAIARASGLSNEQGQKLLDQMVQGETARAEAQATAHQALVDSWKPGGENFAARDKAWRDEALADKDIGAGDPAKFTATLEKAQQALTKYGPELKAYLDDTGLGSHPAAIKFLANIGRAMSESALVVGASGTVSKPANAAQILYPGHYNEDGSPKKS